jgi:FkbM family methyltransferase
MTASKQHNWSNEPESPQKFSDVIYKYLIVDRDVCVETILEIGSRDLQQSIELSEIYKHAKIYAFECNEESYKNIKTLIKEYPNITAINKAVNIYDGTCAFYPIDTSIHNNPGASSIFKSTGKYNHIEVLPQKQTIVECTRLDTWANYNNIEKIDLIWIDVQGAELLVLKSLGKYLQTIKAIHTEVLNNYIYEGQAIFSELDQYLTENKFKLVWSNQVIDGWFGNAIYINTKYFNKTDH